MTLAISAKSIPVKFSVFIVALQYNSSVAYTTSFVFREECTSKHRATFFLAMLINNAQLKTGRKTASVSEALTYRSAGVMMSEMCLGLHLSLFISSIAHSLFRVQIVAWFLRIICYVPELIEHPVKPSSEFSYVVSSVFIVPNFKWTF